MSALLAGLPVPKDVQANVLSYAVGVSIDDPRADVDSDADADEGLVEGLGWKGEYPGVVNVSATIRVGDAKIGAARLTLVDRDLAGASFHAACDAESQELQEVAASFFSRDGRAPRLAAVEALGAEVRGGGVCYVASFRIDDPWANDPTSDVAAEALARLLAAPPLADRWTFCVYIPEAAAFVRAGEASWRPSWRDDRSPEEERAERERRDGYRRRDALPFLRLGFAQADELSRPGVSYLFVARSALRAAPLDRDAAPELRTVAPPPAAAEPSPADAALQRYLSDAFVSIGYVPYGGASEAEFRAAQASVFEQFRAVRMQREQAETLKRQMEAVRAQADSEDAAVRARAASILAIGTNFDAALKRCDDTEAELLGQRRRLDAVETAVDERRASVAAEIRRRVDDGGATVAGARALHVAAQCHNTTCLDLILELGGPGFVDARDPTNGVAPLAVAAATILGKGGPPRRPPLDFLRALVERGADRAARDGEGLTALGHFWRHARSIRDFYASAGLATAGFQYDYDALEREIEALIAPPGGPTPADEAVRDESRRAAEDSSDDEAPES